MKIRITLTEDMLGTKPADRQVFGNWVGSLAPDDDLRKQELETAEHREEAGTTVFHRHPKSGQLMIYDYQVKGFLKEAGNVLRMTEEEPADDDGEPGAKKKKPRKKWAGAKTKIDNCVFVFPRMIELQRTESDGVCERPLRAETMQGPRVSLVRSEVVPAGTTFDVEIRCIPGSPISEKMIRECLDYGALKGLGQWRNSGKGRFSYEVLE
jgi:hypothetical protein